MPLTARSSYRRRRKNPDEKVPERPGESSAQVMAPTRMKLRVRRRDNTAAAATGDEERTRDSGGHSSSRRKNASKATTAAAAAAAASPPTSSTSASARAVMAADEASPDSKCPICLDRFNNLAYLDRCLHRFCFPCIQEWSHNKAECPLCKQPFASILHSVRAEDDFKEYTLRPAPANSSVAATVAMVAAMASAARSDHQMRLMLRRHRVADGGETTTRRRRRERGGRGGGRRGEERAGVWEWYLDSPPLPLPPLPLPQRPVATEDSEDGDELEEQRLRGGADLAERGVIFEGLTGLGGAVAPVAPNDRASRRLMTRLAARQRLQREGGTVRRLRERETVAFRRALYRCGIRVRGVAGNQGQQQQRDITAESFRRNPAHLNRLRPWLRRELTVLYGAHGSLVDIVQRIIMAQLARHGLEDTPTIEEELRPFLLARTEHFLHELVSFARSPLSLDNYDLQAAYEPPAAAMELDGMSSSSDSSSVIAISEGEDEERAEEGRGDGANDDVIQTGSCLSLSGWDDETPGPSYSTAEPSCSLSFSPAPQEPTNDEGGEKRVEEEGEEECLIVGYKKPIAERTPELVQLSSDTEEDEEKKKEEMPEKPPPLPSTALPPYLPTVPPSTSGVYRDEQDGEKDGEVEARHSRARTWSGSSRNSVCTLSPATPGEGERRRERVSWRDRKQPGGEAAREKRRRKRRRRGRERKSGTLYNPNRSIYPAMMRRRSHSPSPFRSSAESGSPPDSSWEYRCSQVSPLTSSVSSPSCSSSSSPFCSSPPPSSPPPPQTPPSLSPSSSTHHGEKPGGKRKYKSRHLDSEVKDPTWRRSGSHHRDRRREKERKRRRGRKRSSSRRSREDRSPSVEIIYEGTITSEAAQPRAHKRRRRRHRGPQYGSSPVIITLDSDSSHEDANVNKNHISSSSSSPLSSQQTVDFCDLPPLPLVHSTGVGGALDAEIGELPVDILDRGSDGSESESKGPIAIDNSDNSDRDVDVENVEEGRALLGGEKAASTNKHDNQPTEEHNDINKRKAPPSDCHLLATILDDLKGISAPKQNHPLNSDSPDARRKRCREPCEVRQNQDICSAEEQNRGFDLPMSCASIPSPSPLKRPTECQVREESQDVPPLLRQASPVRPYNRNTPPPLKHKDAGSPRRSTDSPGELHLHHASEPVIPPVLLSPNPIDSCLAAELPNDKQTIPPISTLKRHFSNALASRGEPNAPSKLIHSKPPIDSHTSFGTSPLSHPDFSYFHPAKLHSSRGDTVETPSPVDLHPVNSSVDFHSANTGWSKEKPAHTDSTSGGGRNKTVSPAVDPHPPPAGSGVFSGVNSKDTSPPAFVSSVGSRTPSSPVDSLCSSKTENSSERISPKAASVDLHAGSPNSTTDPCRSTAVSEGLKPSSAVDHEQSRSEPPPACLNSSCFDGHLNHTALPSSPAEHTANFHTSQSTADSRPQNHFDSQFPVKLSKRGFPLHTDNHVASAENQHNSSVDACSDSQSPERSDGGGGIWNT
ncbi:E3 ubiquitin-protein ligase Topors-like [Stegastes partitus]|uniref:E3 ubiquitin-protein ligase Topors n=1 Tax=Stegastes partitus TaxID=144197 RepID=A0A9Y4KKM9_9TELE|nr:PREDICTED: E3 ubiquitin-protein ligase Topors-like [Stegastes partitus]